MKTVAIVIYEDAFLTAIATSLDLLTTANNLLQRQGKSPAFEILLTGEKIANIQLEQPVHFIYHKKFTEIKHLDLVIVPAFKGDRNPLMVLGKNKTLVQWLKNMYSNGTEVASLCFGCYFLAEAGILGDKSCTSHWMAAEDLQHNYPEITVVPDAVITDEGGIYTGGGGFSSLNLLSYLIEKFCGRDIAIQISKIYSIDLDRANQSHFSIFIGQRNHNDEPILAAQLYIEKHYNNDITIAKAAQMANMSNRNFVRRFKRATHYAPLEYLQRVKIEVAKRALEKNGQDVSQVMYDVGYSDAKTFRELFRRFTGLTPRAYGLKYSRKG